MSTTVQAEPHATPQRTAANEFVSYPHGVPHRVDHDAEAHRLHVESDRHSATWRLDKNAGRLALTWPTSSAPPHAATLAAIETAFALHPDSQTLQLQVPEAMYPSLRHTGIVVDDSEGVPWVPAELFWQQPDLWLPSPKSLPYPQQPISSDGRRHPRRPPKPEGTVYRRYIPWLKATLSFRVLDLERDLECFSRWMNDPVVAHFWEEQGDLAQHRHRLEATLGHPNALPLIACFDDQPFGYFEAYWAKEDRLGAYYDADDFDRGWHLLIGEAAFRGTPYVAAWLPSISHYLFLDDCRTQRLVIEPRVDNAKMLYNLARCGYAHLKAFDFPHKRAMLGMQLREHFFNERSWIPQPPHPGSAPRPDPRFSR
ncbi:GNAT family N-acetyltransferase [Billgrantia aerodenitrificans]|uniref:Acetyltransferase n=1 Tax=Billgrantia aerodenitrificans TaxID=2733483 RepID=A0ABS9ATE0_9GAMM|nr:acetyltransferase [Halomonas aerodenitrificans]